MCDVKECVTINADVKHPLRQNTGNIINVLPRAVFHEQVRPESDSVPSRCFTHLDGVGLCLVQSDGEVFDGDLHRLAAGLVLLGVLLFRPQLVRQPAEVTGSSERSEGGYREVNTQQITDRSTGGRRDTLLPVRHSARVSPGGVDHGAFGLLLGGARLVQHLVQVDVQRLHLLLQLVPGHGGAAVVGLRLGELLLDVTQLRFSLRDSDAESERCLCQTWEGCGREVNGLRVEWVFRSLLSLAADNPGHDDPVLWPAPP